MVQLWHKFRHYYMSKTRISYKVRDYIQYFFQHCETPPHHMLVQLSSSVVSDFVTQWTAAHQAPLSFTNSQSLLKLMSIESVMPSSHLILLLSLSPPAFNLSQQQHIFQSVSSSFQVARV